MLLMMNILGEWQTTQTKSHPLSPTTLPSGIPATRNPHVPHSRHPHNLKPTTATETHADNVAALTLAAADTPTFLLYSAEAAELTSTLPTATLHHAPAPPPVS